MYKLGIIGLSPGNGHPYSWSAIFNGYDKEKMAKCPFPVIPEYLGRQDPADMCIEDAKVTHIWTQDMEVSRRVAETSLIENIAENMTDMIGQVDAVILARDDGENHLKMAQPFIEADLPVFIDKPLTDQQEDLNKFIRYYEEGRSIMSCSSMRYSPSIFELKEKMKSEVENPLGVIRTASAVTPKYWLTYGIHLIEGIYAIMGGGIESVQNIGRQGEEIVHLSFMDGRHAVLQSFADIQNGLLAFFGDTGSAVVQDSDAFSQFKNTMIHFVEMLKTGRPVFDWRQTVEMAGVVIAGQLSLEQAGRVVYLKEICPARLLVPPTKPRISQENSQA